LEIYTLDLYLKVRLACAGGMSQREAAKHFSISCDTVRKMLSYSEPPG
jgi:transposase